MGSLSNYAENALLGHIFTSAYTSPATVYLALLTADPTASDGDTITEVVNSGNYARTAISFGAAASRRITQDALVTFPTASGSWGTVTHWAITDSGTYGAGNVLAHGAFTSSFAPVSGNTPKVASAQVYVEIQATAGGAGFTDATVNSLLGLMFDNTAYSSPAGNTFIALLNATCSDAATTMAGQTEVSGTSYARVEVHESGSASSPRWTAVSGGATSNNAAIDYGTVGAGGWTNIVACAITTALTAGNVIAYDNTNVVDQTSVAAGDTVSFATGAFDISLS